MKNIYKKMIGGTVALFFLSAIFCCSFCGIAQAKTCDMSMSVTSGSALAASVGQQDPSCPLNSNCPGRYLFNVVQPEKLELSHPKIVSQFSKAYFFLAKHVTDSYLTSFLEVSYESPPTSLQKSVPIYLLDRVLRL